MADPQPLAADEIVFRRIPASVPKWTQGGKVHPSAFLPNKRDVDGVSLCRVSSAREAAATGRRGAEFYAVAIPVSKMRERGMTVTADRTDHAFIQGWTFENRERIERSGDAVYLAAICGPVEGPFPGQFELPANPN